MDKLTELGFVNRSLRPSVCCQWQMQLMGIQPCAEHLTTCLWTGTFPKFPDCGACLTQRPRCAAIDWHRCPSGLGGVAVVALACQGGHPSHPGLLQHWHIPVSRFWVSSFSSNSSTKRSWTAGPKPKATEAGHTVPKGSKGASACAGHAGMSNL